MTGRQRLVGALVALAIVIAARGVRADEPARATFALIIGSNVSVDPELPTLKYADDDAASYLDLFRVLGARTYLLSRLDDNTRRLHAQAAAEALEPRRAVFEQVVAQIAADVAQARDRQVETLVYIVYAGHGNVRDGEGYVTLEDMRITGGDLARIVASIPATRVHVIVDACASYFLAYGRGPGGERRAFHGFQDSSLTSDPRVGLLLSTSSARESDEWDGFQAGVFSHEVRSGLYGAADADGDGRVTYREMAAFIAQANGAIPNERFRPNVFARAPGASDTLLDLRHGLERRLDIDSSHAGHYWLEDSRGVRLLDLHNDAGQDVHVVRPSPDGPIYVRRADDDAEFVLPSTPDVVSLAELKENPVRVAARGAAGEAFNLLFSLPFDRSVVANYVTPVVDVPVVSSLHDRDSGPQPSSPLRQAAGWTAIALGAIGVGTGVALTVSADAVARGTSEQTSGADVASRNARVADLAHGAVVGYVTGGVSVAAGVAILLWPASRHVRSTASRTGASIGYAVEFSPIRPSSGLPSVVRS